MRRSRGNFVLSFMEWHHYGRLVLTIWMLVLLLAVDCVTGDDTRPCIHTLSAETGALSTPNYPGQYPTSVSCVWTITAPDGHFVELTFDDFDVEPYEDCKTDLLEIKDGGSVNAPLIGILADSSQDSRSKGGQYCNWRRPPKVVTSTGNQLRLWFLSDSTIQNRGFSAKYRTVFDEPCGGDINSVHGEIASPRFPLHYPRDRECHWRIRVPPGKYIALKFIFFEVETTCPAGAPCKCLDSVSIRDGHSNSATLIGTYCFQAPPPLVTSGNELSITFSSDLYGRLQGFKAIFTQSSTGNCGGDFFIGEGTIESPDFAPGAQATYGPFSDCLWTMTAPEKEEFIAIRFVYMDVRASPEGNCLDDYVEVRDGPTRDSPLIGYYCNSNIPEVLVSSARWLFVRFHSDGTGSGKGFQVHFKAHKQTCETALGMEDGRLHKAQIAVSSSFKIAHEPHVLGPEYGRLNGPYAWCSQELYSDFIGEYFQIEFREFTKVSGFATQGHYMVGNSYYVTRYKIMYSNGKTLLHYANDRDLAKGELYTLYTGNRNYNESVRNEMRSPIVTKLLQIIPLDYVSGRRRHICMRAEVYGCTVDLGDNGQVLTKGSDEINFSTYKKSLSTWLISPDVSMMRPVYIFHVQELEADCATTMLTLSFDGNSIASNQSFCQFQRPAVMANPINRQLWVKLDILSTPLRFQGVRFGYETVDLGLGGLTDAEHGVIHGLHHVLSKINVTSVWLICLPEGSRINVEFKHVNLPTYANGSCDSFVVLKRGLTDSSPTIRNPICGTPPPSSFVLTSNYLRIEYHPGGPHEGRSQVREGFKIRYSVRREEIKTNATTTAVTLSTAISL